MLQPGGGAGRGGGSEAPPHLDLRAGKGAWGLLVCEGCTGSY